VSRFRASCRSREFESISCRLAGGDAGPRAGAVLGTWGALRVGPAWSRIDAHVDTGLPALPQIEETTAGMRAAVFIDQTDHAFFPRSGYRAAGSAYRRALASDSAEQAQDIRRSGSGWLPTGQVSPQPR